MKRILLSLLVTMISVMASAKTDVDFSSKYDEGTQTITALSGWGWYNVMLQDYQVAECEYLYIQYESSCNFNLILQDPNWQNAYSVTCNASDSEAFIKLTPGAYASYSCVVIQNHSEGQITINKCYFCSEDEFFNPAPDDLEGARENLAEIYLRYQKQIDNFLVGNDYGCYPEELFTAFSNALDAALVLDNTEELDKLNAEQLNALSQAIVDSYKALVAGKIMYLPADGYYRLVCARKFVNGDEEYGFFDKVKALYSKNDGENWWDDLKEDDPSYIWKLEKQADNTYLMQNPNNRLAFNSPERCGADNNIHISIDAVRKTNGVYDLGYELSTDKDIVVFNFRMSNEPANDYKYVHMNWHSGGTGWNGPLTTWCNYQNDPCGASEWYLQPVDEELAQSLLNTNAFGHDFVEMLADAKAKMVLANDMTRTKLITDAAQMTSPYSQNDLGNADGGNLREGVLLDGNNGTFWHSYWAGGNVEAGIHYLQIELLEELSGLFEFDFSRRKNASDDHVTTWGIYGSNEPDGEKYDFEWIADVNTPYGTNNESLAATFDTEGKAFKYLRFYAEATSSNRGYWHVSEFQLYSLEDNPTNQAKGMGDVYAKLAEAVQAAEQVDVNAVSREAYEALKAAYEPFITLFVDPSALRAAINDADPALNLVETGSNPGQWKEGVTDDFLKLLAEAKTYDKGGIYTQAQTDAYMEALSDPQAKVMALANKVDPKKYYAIRFASEEKYEEMGWSTSNVLSETSGDLYDTYLCAIEAEEDPEAEEVQEPGINLIFSNNSAADIEFYFVPTDDGLYTIKHKATGRYIHVNGYDSWTNLTSEATTYFTIEAIGHGENIIHATDSEGNDLAYLHAQLSDHRLVTWHDHYAGSNSGLILEELGDISEEDAIANVEQASDKKANIYNVAGQLVRKNAKQADVKGLSKGLYIVDGTKILVK